MSHVVASSPGVSNRMSRQASRHTGPELALRRELHRRGLRYRLHTKVPAMSRRTIDIAFTRRRLAVFVDGCFWHRCPVHATYPASNAPWWAHKLERNVERDHETDAALRNAGWQVLRIWEHTPVTEAADAVERILRETVSGDR